MGRVAFLRASSAFSVSADRTPEHLMDWFGWELSCHGFAVSVSPTI